MARQEVVQVRCDRCKRVELRPAPLPPKEKPDLVLEFGGKKIVFEDLDLPCRAACERIVKELEEWDREVKHQFGPTVHANQAATLSPAPNYTPPQPHANGHRK